ncbi:MAG: DUF4258 domain-containing protein [Deltaproteobacteria bacterium]|nr:DUF4258 domain-containing protein [Deltaproteobacteria bacterium]
MAERVEYTQHAHLRMTQRNISEAEVEAVLSNPSYSYTDKAGNPVHVGYPAGRRIKVVVAKDSNPPKIITTAD